MGWNGKIAREDEKRRETEKEREMVLVGEELFDKAWVRSRPPWQN